MADPKKACAHVLRGQTVRMDTPLGTAFVIVNYDDNDQPFEVFCNVGKAGSDIAAVSEAIGRLISLALRMSPDLTPAERMQEVIEQLAGIGGGRPMGYGAQRVRSLPDGIAKALEDALGLVRLPLENADPGVPEADSPNHAIGDLCPHCGQATWVGKESKGCTQCGYREDQNSAGSDS